MFWFRSGNQRIDRPQLERHTITNPITNLNQLAPRHKLPKYVWPLWRCTNTKISACDLEYSKQPLELRTSYICIHIYWLNISERTKGTGFFPSTRVCAMCSLVCVCQNKICPDPSLDWEWGGLLMLLLLLFAAAVAILMMMMMITMVCMEIG